MRTSVVLLGVTVAAAAMGTLWAKTRPSGDLTVVRRLALGSEQYGQNWMRPGCGNGRESANAHKRQLVRSLNARPALLPLLIQDPNPKVRAAAILEAGWSGRRGSERLIGIALLRDPDPNLREYAAGALARLGGAEAIKALNAGVADPILDVRVLSTAALLSLGQRVDPKVRARLDEEAQATGKRTSTSWLLSLQM